jgi:hypothetical protein
VDCSGSTRLLPKKTVAAGLLAFCACAGAFALQAGITVPGTTAYPNAGMRRVGKVTLSSATYSGLYGGAVDANGYGYFGTANAISPGHVIKVDLHGPLPVEVGAGTAAAGEGNLNSIAVDSAAGYLYVAAAGGRLLKFTTGVGGGPPVYVGSTALLSGEFGSGVVIDTRDPDPANHFLYIATFGTPASVLKYAPGAGTALPTRVGAVAMQTGENNLRRGAADLVHGYAYFATLSASTSVLPTVVKIALTAGSAAPVRVGAVQLDGTTSYSIGSAVLDVGNGYGYFGTYDVGLVPAKVFKIALGAGAAPPTLVGSVTLSAGPPAERELSCAVIDPASGYAYFGTDHTYAAKIFKIKLGAGNALPTEAGVLQLQSGSQPNPADGVNVINNPETLYGEVFLQSAIFDGAGYAYWGTDSNHGQVVQTAISEKGAMKGTKVVLAQPGAANSVSFYSHAAAGHVRLAIYDDQSPKHLLWESAAIPNSAAGGWIAAPIASGAPSSLPLPAGTYWLAWQVDVATDVPSYTAGTSGDGFTIEQPFGPSPAAIAAPQSTSEKWSIFLDYGVAPPPSGLSYYTVPPCRIIDTRAPPGPAGGPSLAGGTSRSVSIAGGCGVPSGAAAAAVNVTVTGSGSPGYLTIFPGGVLPGTSTLNFRAGQTRANNAAVSLDGTGSLTVFAGLAGGTLDFIVDVVGYFQ